MLLLRRASPGAYAGMDRPRLEGDLTVPEPLRLEAAALEDLPIGRAAAAARALAGRAGPDWEAVWVGGEPLPGAEVLGWDVGERLPSFWSALARAEALLGAEEGARWLARTNRYGLFERRGDAEAFLERYLSADDPDRGWTAEGWTEAPDWYAALLIQRLPAA